MNKPKMTYFAENDTLHLIISEVNEAGSVELSPIVTSELNDRGELIGIEILDASSFMRDSIFDTALLIFCYRRAMVSIDKSDMIPNIGSSARISPFS